MATQKQFEHEARKLGKYDAIAGRLYRHSIPADSTLRPWLSQYDQGWNQQRNLEHTT